MKVKSESEVTDGLMVYKDAIYTAITVQRRDKKMKPCWSKFGQECFKILIVSFREMSIKI